MLTCNSMLQQARRFDYNSVLFLFPHDSIMLWLFIQGSSEGPKGMKRNCLSIISKPFVAGVFAS